MSEAFPWLAERTLPQVLRARARDVPDGTACVIAYPDRDDEVYSIAELMRLAERYAARYASLARGEEPALVCVCLYHGIHLHAAFVGALLAGQIPSMIAPPSPRMDREKYLRSFVRMLGHIRPDVLVADGEVLGALRRLEVTEAVGGLLLDPTEIEAADVPAVAAPPAPSDASVAFLQHSSGTTGLQKGVALSHRAVLQQLRAYIPAIGLQPSDVILSWLPLYHDMGLIACFVLPLLSGVPVVELSPFDWVARPGLLLRKAQQHGATLCWLPNFAYSFMSKSIRGAVAEHGDLASVRAFVNCSEPVMAASHREFVERFGTVGVTAERLTACYAMAENVFAATQSAPGKPPRVDRISRSRFEREHLAEQAEEGEAALELVSNGRPIDGVEVRIVDDAGAGLPPRSVGEICLRGSSLFAGYFRRDDLTEQAFDGDWYRTGDLGYLADDELYVTGRKKDLIIIQGRNFYPADVEAAVAEIDGVIGGRVVAFGAADAQSGTESLVLIAESAEQDPAEQGRIKREIRAHVAQSFDCTVGGVHIVPPRWMVKSTAGKVARADNRSKYERLLRG